MISDRAVVIGAGLSGLTTAAMLVDHGVTVTVIDAADRAGGKLASWRDHDDDLIAQATHTYWPSYRNLFELLRHVGAPGQSFYDGPRTLADLPGGRRLRAILPNIPSPRSLVRMVLQSPAQAWHDLAAMRRVLFGVLDFDAAQDYRSLDRYTFRSWLWRRAVTRRSYDWLLGPYVRAFGFDSAARISAAAVVSSLQQHVLGEVAGGGRWLRTDAHQAIIDPLVRYIESHGGKVVTGVPATGFRVDSSGRAVGIETTRLVAQASLREPPGAEGIARVKLGAIPDTGFITVEGEHDAPLRVGREHGRIVAHADSARIPGVPTGGDSVALPKLQVDTTGSTVSIRVAPARGIGAEIGRMALADLPVEGFVPLAGQQPVLVGRINGSVLAFSAACTHKGCTITWQSATKQFMCPCHGAAFASDGSVLAGPAQRRLPSLTVELSADTVVVGAAAEDRPVLEAEHFIIATDVAGAQGVLSPRLRQLDFFRRIDFLQTTPVIVVRYWFPGASLLGEPVFGALPAAPFIDQFYVISNLQQGHRDSETVIEAQAYAAYGAIDRSDDEIADLALADLRHAFPTLAGTPRKRVVLRHRASTSFHAAGADSYRPNTRTPIPNLYFAGDWVGSESTCWNLERAVVTGMRAANALIEDSGGVGTAPLDATRPGGLFELLLTIIRALVSWRERFAGVLRGDPAPPRAAPPPSPAWRSVVFFSVTKFPGQPNVQEVFGMFRRVAGTAEIVIDRVGVCASGEFVIDLESLDTGTPLRDYNVRTALFDTPHRPTARFSLKEARPLDAGVRNLALGAFTANCRGDLEINDVRVPIEFRARVIPQRPRTLYVRSLDDLQISPSQFGLDLSRLTRRSGAEIEDAVRVSFRLAVPWRRAR